MMRIVVVTPSLVAMALGKLAFVVNCVYGGFNCSFVFYSDGFVLSIGFDLHL